MRFVLCLLPALLIAHFVPAQEAKKESGKVETFQLENGLSVFLRPVQGAKDVALVVLYSLGGDHDPKGRSGLAHVVEHLQCTSAAGEFPIRTFADILQRYPRGQNFQTGDSYTVHAVVFPAKELDRELKEMAARMAGLKITGADLDRELPRIDEELRNMFGGIPTLAALNLAREKVRPAPLGGRKGGVFQHIKAMTLDELKERWRDYYKPNNAILVLAGAIDVDAARKAIAASFAKMPAGKQLPAALAPGKPVLGQVEEVAVKAAFPQAEPALCVAFRAPSPQSDLFPAFLVLVARMQFDRAKLDPDPKRFPIYYAAIDDPEAIYFNLRAGKDDTAKALLARVRKFIAAIAESEVTAADGQRTSLFFGRFFGLRELPDAFLAEDPYGVAFALGRRQQLGIDSARLAKAIAAVTTKDLERVLRDVFGEDRFAAVLVRPQ
jgi:zinc protease